MKLTFPILTLSKGGAQRMLAELANRLAGFGHDVTILMPRNGIVEYPMNCKIIYSAGPVGISAADFPFSDVIISNYYSTVAVSQQASEAGKGIHTRLTLCYEPTFLPDNNVSFASYNVTRNLFVLSNWQQSLVQLVHGIKGRIVPIGVNPDFYNMKLHREEGRRLIVSTILRKPEGGFSDHREQAYLIRQLNRVKECHPEVDIYLIIPPREFAESAMLQEFLHDPNYQIRTPANDVELCYHYNESDIFVSASTHDAGSLPGLEAMRCGAALVTTYAGGNMEYCSPGENCLMSYRYENKLAEDVLRLIQDPELLAKLALKGEQDSQRFTWQQSAEILQRELLEILSQ
ncbi:glycosyltransferase family 4 protein [Paenibacillus sp. GCM10012306]|uniref:glycosyltransferase family 4 protein n=1 Tax=Paenibacillus sp. GCM10012306 TaxID=3317342 RepID=UPI00360F46C1